MKVKKYTASSMPEAMMKVRSELGSDAVILNSKTLQSHGFFGLFKKNSIEVIAAIDPELTSSPRQHAKERVEPGTFRSQQSRVPEERRAAGNQEDNELLKEISQLREMLQDTGLENKLAVPLPAPIKSQVEWLAGQEVDPEYINELTASLLERWYVSGAAEEERKVRQWCAEEIKGKLSNYSFGGLTFRKKFINVVGPTGVGKTTTLAKIAAESVLKHNKKVAFITTDTYRIAAIEQLKTYAGILDVPIEVCYNLEDFKEAADKFDEYDHIFIDTAGRNFRNKKYVEDLKRAIDFGHEMETFLVLSLTAKQRDMEEIYRQFSLIAIDRFIFTKLDETAMHGSMLNMINKFSTGAAYLTNGQDVPDDLIAASPGIIAETILGARSYE
ncbi:flagellar biosynthesis protein FlhF [Bacillus sp. REN3]|uniref:flagellar biosynthesis protein FlhF n=1 Tax=Bacillus sp. REN3 TaxID=2802440 RepID=UPI001AEDF45A|nr:flagellar biosynthesis protein FlhF [Bacillus sp. REN3]